MKLNQIIDPILLKFGREKVRCLDFTPTWKCNARCVMCSIWRTKSDAELSKAQTERIFVHFNDLELVLVQGGEVSLWPYLRWMVFYYLENYKGEILILTNGIDSRFWMNAIMFWKNRQPDEFKRIRFMVSLDGKEKTHDKIRGLKGAYANATKTAQFISEMGSRIHIQFMPMKINEDDYSHVRNFALHIGARISTCYPVSRTRFEAEAKCLKVDNEKLMRMYESEINRMPFFAKWLRSSFLDHIKDQRPMPCVAGRQIVHVSPEGHIRPCVMSNSTMGIVTDHNIQVWKIPNNIPKRCQYIQGKVCSDFIPMYSLEKEMFHLLKWRVRKCLT